MTTFDDSFEQLWDITYRVAFRVLGNRGDAEDVAQDTLIRVAERWSRVEAYAPAFVSRVAGQRAIDSWRKRYPTRPAQPPPSGSSAVEERLELVEALRRLPRRQRETVVLRYLADLSEQTTADALGCSVGAVKQHASRALTALRATLDHSQTGA